MSGHSKWATIKHQKGAKDARRGKLFAKLIRGIEVAARTGGASPEGNPTLADAIQKAKDNSVPNDTIERAIKRGSGELEGQQLELVTYEGYGPGGVAMLIEALTDNRNRTASAVRHAFAKAGGNMAEAGSVAYLFNRKGQVVIPAEGVDEDRVMEVALEAGAEDVESGEDGFVVTTAPGDLREVRAAFERAGIAYEPMVEALRPLGELLGPEELERVLAGARPELARLVPELGAPVASVSSRGGSVGAEATGVLEPGRLFELLLGVLHRRHPLRGFLAELERSGRVERLELGRLGRRELGELLAGILGEPPAPALVDEILARSEGNPFFAEELLAARVGGVGGSAELPEALRDLLLARVEALPEATQRMLQVAAVAGRRVDHDLLAEVAAQPPERLVELLREAVTHHLLVVDGGSGAYAFRHALVQEAIYDDLLPVQRPPLHAASAHALAARIEGEGGAGAAELGRLAYHWYAAHDLGRALLASVQAGQAAEAAFALAEAAGHYERALELWEQAPEAAANSPLDRSSLLQRAAQAASRVGEGARAVALINQAPAVPGGRLPGRRAAGRRRAGVRPRPARLGPGRQAPADRQGLPGAPRPGCDHLL